MFWFWILYWSAMWPSHETSDTSLKLGSPQFPHRWSEVEVLLSHPPLHYVPSLQVLFLTYLPSPSENNVVWDVPSAFGPLCIRQLLTQCYLRAFAEQLSKNLSCWNFMQLKILRLQMIKNMALCWNTLHNNPRLKKSSRSRIFIGKV